MNSEGIVITRTPFRVSLLGGGTDFPDFFNKYGGATLGMAINKYLYVTANSLPRLFDKRIRLSYSKLEMLDNYQDLQHPYVRQIMKTHQDFRDGDFLDMHTFSDLPAASGMGSSSAFTVGFLNAMYLLNQRFVSPEQLAKEAIHIEREELKESGGWQDQIFAAYGGFNRIDYIDNSFTVKPVVIDQKLQELLETSMVMVFTNQTRSSTEIQQSVFKQENKTADELHIAMKKLVDKAEAALGSKEARTSIITHLGDLLDQAWQLKRQLGTKVSNPDIDALYQHGKDLGAIGGKLCGAGGGGFILFIVPAEKKQNFLAGLKDQKHIEFKIENHGSQPIYSNLTSESA